MKEAKTTHEDSLLTPDEVVEYFKNTVTASTLQNWRSKGIGPNYIKIGNKALYRKSSLDEYLEEKMTVHAS